MNDLNEKAEHEQTMDQEGIHSCRVTSARRARPLSHSALRPLLVVTIVKCSCFELCQTVQQPPAAH